jgi:uncharacterized protein (TIGR00297 family)
VDFALRFLIGLVAAACVGAVAYRARALSGGGGAAAALIGTAAVAAGWDWAALLILYFVSSTLLSRVGRERKRQRTSGVIEKPGPRDSTQVMANGVVFLLAASFAAFGVLRLDLAMAAGAGALAASAADTWATEVGTLVARTPRSILDGRPLAVGESGGVTLAGSLASIAGAAFIAVVAVGAGWPPDGAVAIVAGGVAGSAGDSILGRTLQERRWCDACGKATEMSLHQCGAVTRRVGGVGVIGNDAVNFLATAIGAIVAVSLVLAGA